MTWGSRVGSDTTYMAWNLKLYTCYSNNSMKQWKICSKVEKVIAQKSLVTIIAAEQRGFFCFVKSSLKKLLNRSRAAVVAEQQQLNFFCRAEINLHIRVFSNPSWRDFLQWQCNRERNSSNSERWKWILRLVSNILQTRTWRKVLKLTPEYL